VATAWKILYLFIVFAGGFWLTTWAIPKTYVAVGRLLGFSLKMTPITQKRIMRFKRIRRGYWSFISISTLFVISLFLELIVNQRPLAIHFNGHTSFPAVQEWVNKAIPLYEASLFLPKEEFAQNGSGEVDYHLFAEMCADPSRLDEQLDKSLGQLKKAQSRFAKLEPPAPDASEFQKSRYEQREAMVNKRQRLYDELLEAKEAFARGDAWIVPTLYPYSPASLRHNFESPPPNTPSMEMGIPLGTTVAGRDVLVLLVYGFRISLSFALLVAICGYAFGVVIGGLQGYYGGWVDIGMQRFVEIWGSIPFLFTIMIIGSLMTPSFAVLATLMIVLRSWLGITFYVRGEFYREKSKDYVQAAIGSGVSDWKIIMKHILPNSLVPVVTFAPFGIVAYISSLVSLDYLGFGLPPGTPSWGALLHQGLENVKFYPYLVIVPVVALALTLYSVVIVGEAVREAFDPKVFSRLR
jgi:microcin C transport system permease protein